MDYANLGAQLAIAATTFIGLLIQQRRAKLRRLKAAADREARSPDDETPALQLAKQALRRAEAADVRATEAAKRADPEGVQRAVEARLLHHVDERIRIALADHAGRVRAEFDQLKGAVERRSLTGSPEVQARVDQWATLLRGEIERARSECDNDIDQLGQKVGVLSELVQRNLGRLEGSGSLSETTPWPPPTPPRRPRGR